MKDLLGGKGSGLAEMTNAGLPVPPGFTISTDVCNIYYEEKAQDSRRRSTARSTSNLKKLEKAAGATLGSTDEPAARLGPLGREVLDARHDGHDPQPRPERRRGRRAEGRTQNGRFAFDSYRRFIQMFGNVVLEIPKDAFEHEFEAVKTGARREARHRPRRERAARGRRRATRRSCRSRPGKRVPAGSARAAARWRATPCSARG